MREIKFRAWDSYQKIMYQWNEIGELDNAMNLSIWDALNGFVPQIKMMQFTGLKDKNGKEIYEGDILIPGYASGEFFIVVFDKNRGIFTEQRVQPGIIPSDVYIMDGSFLAHAKLEIIGNIHQNPELLKG